MEFPNIICPYDPDLLKRLKGYSIVVRVSDPSEIVRAADAVKASPNNNLLNIIVDFQQPLDVFEFQDEWLGIPLAVFFPEMGPFRNVRKNLDRIRKLKAHIYLPSEHDENLTSSRILSSLGITCCLTFSRNKVPNWESLADLMTYAILGAVSHAPLEPFTYISNHYDAKKYCEWDSTCFASPREYLHVDSRGRVALSQDELLKEVFITDDLFKLKNPLDCPEYAERINVRKRFFLENHPCAQCEGWKICLGKFLLKGKPAADGCMAFCRELLDALEQKNGQTQ
jgi:hypothetical protein